MKKLTHQLKKLKTVKKIIKSIHTLFGGRIRGLLGVDTQERFDLPIGIPSNEDQRLVLELLRNKTKVHGFDPFRPCVVSKQEIEHALLRHNNNVNVETTLSHLQERKYINQTSDGGYRFYSPIIYSWMVKITSTIFISHAIADFQEKLPLIASLKPFFICCEDGESKIAMTQSSLANWMKAQVDSCPLHHLILIVLSKNYCDKVVTDPKSGCAIEFYLILDRAKDENFRENLIWTRRGDIFNNSNFLACKKMIEDVYGSLPLILELDDDLTAILGRLHLDQITNMRTEN